MAEPSGNELASAAAKGDLVQLTNLLQKNVNVNAQNGFGRTALQVGIQRGRKIFHHCYLRDPGFQKDNVLNRLVDEIRVFLKLVGCHFFITLVAPTPKNDVLEIKLVKTISSVGDHPQCQTGCKFNNIL